VSARLPQVWRTRSFRFAAIPVLLVGAVLAGFLALDPALSSSQGPRSYVVAALLFSFLLAGAALVLWLAERETSRVRRALAAGISHDMRTPLAQIRMFTEMLLMGRERSEEERMRWLETIERESHRLGDVMENLLLFVHGEEAEPYPARQPTDLGALIEDVAVGFSARAAVRRMRIVAEPPGGVMALVDPQAVRQVVTNLLDNAVRYGTSGQTVSVSLEAIPAAGRAVIIVADQGPGIPSSDHGRVWQPFVRLGEGAGAEGGSGLGLTVVRQVVEAHGGRVWIDNVSGGGARVCASFPMLAAAGSQPAPAPAAASSERLLPTRH
jgi:signal transduction histidine kinase